MFIFGLTRVYVLNVTQNRSGSSDRLGGLMGEPASCSMEEEVLESASVIWVCDPRQLKRKHLFLIARDPRHFWSQTRLARHRGTPQRRPAFEMCVSLEEVLSQPTLVGLCDF